MQVPQSVSRQAWHSLHKVHQAAREQRNRAKARRQPNSSTLPVAPCLRSPLNLHLNCHTASTQYLTRGQWQKLPLMWKNRRNGSQRCVGFISQTSMPEKVKESQPPTRHREWKNSARSATTFTRLGGEDDRVPCRMDSHAP